MQKPKKKEATWISDERGRQREYSVIRVDELEVEEKTKQKKKQKKGGIGALAHWHPQPTEVLPWR